MRFLDECYALHRSTTVGLMSLMGHSRLGPAGRRSSHVRYAPKATVGHQKCDRSRRAKSGHYRPIEACYYLSSIRDRLSGAKLGEPMKRREFMVLLASTIALRPNPLLAQQGGRIFKIGHLESSTPSNSPQLLGAFRDRLRELGYVEGQNLFIERRYAEGKEERLPQLASELVKYGVDVIFAIGPPQALAAAKATDKIPIVFVGGGDPVALALVKSFAHPGGNVTGITFVTVELAPKRIQMLHEAVPGSKRMGVLWNPINVVNKLELEAATKTPRYSD
jgi:hypothetical protein